MSEAVVVFDQVWKKFRRGERHDSLRDLVPSLVRGAFRKRNRSDLENANEFWALKDVSFSVQRGEALGIIGPNGAGKSTSLKLLTRILRPTRGACHVRGRVGALIEVAAGFHPDLTGRENIFLQGAVMGMRRAEIAARLDEIIDFAGVEEFVDTPVKRYSSGMNARLGFSIAAHLDPDVLIIDEVLSVGDAAFQRRCLERMFTFRERGTTIVFVSHDLQAISTLCHRVLYLRGDARALGPTSEVLAQYLRDSAKSSASSSDAPIVMSRSRLLDSSELDVLTVSPGSNVTVRVECEIREPMEDLTFGFILYRSTDNLIVYEGNIVASEIGFVSTRRGLQSIDFNFRVNLIRGQYHVECYTLHTPTHRYIARLSPAAMFSVHDEATCSGVADISLRASVHEPVLN